MLTIYNAQCADNHYYTFVIKKKIFSKITKQKDYIHHSSSHIPLADVGTLNHDDKELLCDARGELLVPGAIDCHVHSREPGHSYKETWKTLGQSAFKGGVTTIIDMPNTSPATLDRETVLEKVAIAEKSGLNYKFLLGVVDSNLKTIGSLLNDDSLPLAGVKVYYGRSTGNLLFDNLEALSPVAQNTSKVFVFHCEQQEIIEENLKLYEKKLTDMKNPSDFIIHSQIRPSKAAIKATETVLNWALNTKSRVHIAHVSTPQEIELIEKAKKKSNKITCEVAPHHLYFCDEDYKKHGGYIKVNPPVRSKKERNLLKTLTLQGKANCFATDHAPHSKLEKIGNYNSVPSGIPSLEFFWPLLYNLLETGQRALSLAELIPIVTTEPAAIFGFNRLAGFIPNSCVNMVCLERKKWTLTKNHLEAKCSWSPYVDFEFQAKVKHTWCQGKRVY